MSWGATWIERLLRARSRGGQRHLRILPYANPAYPLHTVVTGYRSEVEVTGVE